MNSERSTGGKFAKTHGMRNERIYSVWCAMKERCQNPHNKSYARYGARGVSVCREWEEFATFYAWALSAGYRDWLTIDRIDNSKGYCPDNCRWATISQQNRNYSRNRMITYNGETKCLTDWAESNGIKPSTLAYRLKSGKPMEDALSRIDGRKTRWTKTTS